MRRRLCRRLRHRLGGALLVEEGAGFGVVINNDRLPCFRDLRIVSGGVPQEPFRRLCLDDEVRADGKVRHLIDALLHFFHGADLFALRLIQSLELFRVVIDRELAAGQFVFGVVLVHLGQGQFADGCLLGLRLGIGREGEPYEGIGRGMLNIGGMPVYRDSVGGIGTPTSDNERTKMSMGTTKLLALVNGYDGDRDNVMRCAEFICDLLRKYASSDGGEIVAY